MAYRRGTLYCGGMPKETVDQYRRRAAEADEWAANTTDAFVRGKFEAIARHWRELADRIEPERGLVVDGELAPDASAGSCVGLGIQRDGQPLS